MTGKQDQRDQGESPDQDKALLPFNKPWSYLESVAAGLNDQCDQCGAMLEGERCPVCEAAEQKE